VKLEKAHDSFTVHEMRESKVSDNRRSLVVLNYSHCYRHAIYRKVPNLYRILCHFWTVYRAYSVKSQNLRRQTRRAVGRVCVRVRVCVYRTRSRW